MCAQPVSRPRPRAAPVHPCQTFQSEPCLCLRGPCCALACPALPRPPLPYSAQGNALEVQLSSGLPSMPWPRQGRAGQGEALPEVCSQLPTGHWVSLATDSSTVLARHAPCVVVPSRASGVRIEHKNNGTAIPRLNPLQAALPTHDTQSPYNCTRYQLRAQGPRREWPGMGT